jgi:cephalosporin hydroxylase
MADGEPGRTMPLRKLIGWVLLAVALVLLAFQLGLWDFYLVWRSPRYYRDAKPEWKNEIYGIELLQYPQDLVVYQDILHRTRPDAIVETGTYQGGTALYFATLLEFVNPKARIITIDINGTFWRSTLERLDVPTKDRLLGRITFLEADSLQPETLEKIKKLIPAEARVMVLLDSVHTYEFVREELQRYAPLVTVGQYLIVNDTQWGGPLDAVREFVREHPEFEIDRSVERFTVSCAYSGFLKRVK